MTQYTYAQLEQLWINAGGPKAQAPLAAAIAEAESSGQSTAENKTDNNGTQTSWGLWQISNGTHSMPVANILNPAVNAQQAVAKYNAAGDSFSPWGTYATGAYKAFLNGKTTPDPNVPGGTAATLTAADQTAAAGDCLWFITYPGGNVGGWIGGIIGSAGGNPFSTVNPAAGKGGGACLFSKGEARALLGGLMMVGGGIVGVVGLAVLVASGLGGTKAGQAVTSVIPQAAVLKAASTVGRARKAVPRARAAS